MSLYVLYIFIYSFSVCFFFLPKLSYCFCNCYFIYIFVSLFVFVCVLRLIHLTYCFKMGSLRRWRIINTENHFMLPNKYVIIQYIRIQHNQVLICVSKVLTDAVAIVKEKMLIFFKTT